MTKADIYNRSVATAWSSLSGEDLQREAELAALVKATAGRQLDDNAFSSLSSVQRELHARQAALTRQLDSGGISPERYLSDLNAASKKAIEDSRSLLGNEQFAAIFGPAERQINDLIDRDVFLADSRKRKLG